MAKNAFDNVLESLSEDTRKAVTELAEKEPKLKDMMLAQSDYSRRMDEVKSKVDMADQWKAWRDNNWVEDKKMTKAELVKQERLEALERDLEAARTAALGTGEDMTFDQLTQWSTKFLQDNKIVTGDALEQRLNAKAKDLEAYVKGGQEALGNAAIEVPYLIAKHQQEFGEILDPKPLIASAVEKGQFDLREFYEKNWVIERRTKAMQDKHTAEMAKLEGERVKAVEARDAAEEARKAALLGATGQGSPADMGGPSMGPLQKQFVGEQKAPDGSAAPSGALGDNSIAAFAARQYMQKQAGQGA